MALSAGSVEIRLFAELARLQSDMKKANKVVEDAMGGIQKTVRATTSLFNNMAASFGASQIVKLADDYKRFDSQLKLSTKSLYEYNEAYSNVIRIGRTAQSDIGAIGVLYARLNNNLRDFNVTQSQVAGVTETISLALRTNNATVQETNSVMLQLSQSFGSGKLNGQEFLAVAEGAPMLLRQLAASLKVPFGALKDLSAQGKITREDLLKAWSDPAYLAALREQVKEVGTVTSSITVLMNNLKQYIGESDKATGATKALSGGIMLIADNINTLVSGAIAFGIVAFVKWSQTQLSALQASRAMAAQSVINAKVELSLAQAAYASGAAVTKKTAAMANNAAATTMATSNTARLIAAERALVAATSTTAVAFRGLSAALSMFGGPIGLAVTGVILFGDKLLAFVDKVRGVTPELKKINEQIERNNQLRKIGVSNDDPLAAERESIAKTVAEVARLQEMRDRVQRMGKNAGFYMMFSTPAEKIAEIDAQIEQARVNISATMKSITQGNASVTSSTNENAEAFTKLSEKLKTAKELAAEYANNQRMIMIEGNKAGLSQDEILAKLALLKGQYDKTTGAIKEQNKAVKELSNANKERLKELQDQIDFEMEMLELKNKRELELTRENDEERKARIEEAVEKQKEFNAEVEKIKDAVDPTRAYAREIAKLGEMFNLNRISADEFSKAAIDSQKRMLSQVEKDSDFMKSIADSAAKNMQNSFADFLFDPFKDGLGGMLSNFANTLRRMAADQLALSIFKQINSSFGGSEGFGAVVSSLFGGARADGGDVRSNKAYLVGERGPEIFMPKGNGTIVPNHEIGNAQAPVQSAPPTVNIKNINVLDPSLIGNYLNTDDGERLIMNTIQRNRSAFGI